MLSLAVLNTLTILLMLEMFFKSYFVSLGVSLLMSLFLIVTITTLILYQVALSKIDEQGWFNTSDLNLFYIGKNAVFFSHDFYHCFFTF